MRIIIAGSRYFTNYELLAAKCDYYLSKTDSIEVVSGRCPVGTLTFIAPDGVEVYGADGLSERYAQERGYPVKLFPADWDLGTFAGPLRNIEMAQYADALIAFYDGVSRGTGHMIKVAREKGIRVKEIKIEI